MFGPDTVVADALAQHPRVRWVFAAYHVGGCNSCERATGETLQELADGYRIPLERFLSDLNAIFESATG
jgi:hypothetical protein